MTDSQSKNSGKSMPRAQKGGPQLEILGFKPRSELDLPLYLATVAAGFPSPADDYIDKTLDLNEHLISHPEATFFVRVYGDSMRDAGIQSGDILIVDRAVEPRNGSVVIAALNGELTVKRLHKQQDKLLLVPEHPEFSPIEVTEDASFEIWGIVSYVIHKV